MPEALARMAMAASIHPPTDPRMVVVTSLDSRKAAFRMHQLYCTSTRHRKGAAADVITPSRLVHPSNQRASTPDPDRGTAL